MSRRRLAYIAIAVALLVIGRLLALKTKPSNSPSASGTPEASESSSAGPALSAPGHGPRLRRPPSPSVTLGVLTDRPEPELQAIIERDALAALIVPKFCGDEQACDAVRSTLRDEHATSLNIVAAADWNSGRLDVDASAGALTPAERASVVKRKRVVIIHVATAVSTRHMAVRAALAAAAAVAEKTGGLVHDPLLSRLEGPKAFASHVVTAPLDASAFRRDRVEVLYEPKGHGVVRVLTAGLSRWGAPDVEAAQVPALAQERMAEIVLGVAEALANGTREGPVVLSRDDIGRACGIEYPVDAGWPAIAPIAIDLLSVQPETGDPNDFLARIEPAGGDGPVGYVDLAERFFGSVLAPPPESDVMQKRRGEAQRRLSSALEHWSAAHASGAKLFVELPFPIPGDAGLESMWVEITRYDARTVTGKLVDEPLGATDVARGDVVTRPREDVEDIAAKR